MTVEELLKACSNGTMPRVDYQGITGQVTMIKISCTNGYKGCEVWFPGRTSNTWFHDEPEGKDKRSRYMKDLTLKTTTP